jgi:hypothetical protein
MPTAKHSFGGIALYIFYCILNLRKKGVQMSFDSWTCLAVPKGGGTIPDELMHVAKMSACRLHLEKRTSLLFTSDVCDGYITTSWEGQQIGSRSGIFFSVEASMDDEEWQINFLMNTRDLEQGALLLEKGEEFDPEDVMSVNLPFRLPLDRLYEFRDLRSRTLN